MIPIRLALRNFMCYTDQHEPLEFAGIHVACLSGPNGHGKSALLDAMTWALWGKSRAQRDDDLVSLAGNSPEMEVELDFRLGDAEYRVLRKRNRRGNGRSTLDLQVRQDDGTYRSLTGSNMRDTQRQIDELLRMSYETFTNSSFVLQGKADSFTTRTPGERKTVLAEILDLSYYDKVEERARKAVAERTEQQNVLQLQIREDDAELQQQPELEAERKQLEAEVGQVEEELKLLEARGEALRERLNRLQTDERDLREQERRFEEATARAARYRQQVATAEAALRQAQAVLARQSEIERGYASLLERRAELEKLAISQAEHGRLAYEVQCLQRIIAQERGRLEGRQRELGQQIESLAADAARTDRVRAELDAARAEQSELDALETRRVELEARRVETRERWSAAKAHVAQRKLRIEELHQHQQLLVGAPVCPVCRTSLGKDRHHEVLSQYERDEAKLAAALAHDEREVEQLTQAGLKLKAEIEQLGDLAARRKQVHDRVAKYEATLARADEQTRSLEKLRDEAGQLQRALSSNDYCPGERTEIVKLERQILSLGYDPAAHQVVATAATELAPFESQHQDLLEARRSIQREEQTRQEAAQALAEWEEVAAAAEQRRVELLATTADLPAARAELASAEGELRALRGRHVELSQRLGGVRQRLSTMAFIAGRRAERRAELERVVNERSIYLQLVEAFGKKGLQALLIETAIPEIEDEANRLLDIMTDGRMRVAFKTQRAARTGDSQIETLDILISDELGSRPYEMYSGGEAFRVNFAVRIALSKLLARRAGARLQTLVIDEGFGSQDEQGRDRLVEAIRAIQDEFEKILIITHLSDLKDVFPTRIEVTKTPAGSVIDIF